MARRLPDTPSLYELSPRELPLNADGTVRWHEVFGACRPLRVEIGVGNSTFLIEVSRERPEFNYLGFEYSGKRVTKFLKKVELAGLSNIRMLRMNICDVLDRFFEAASIDRFYINHPDPWPKRRHAKKRFVSPANALTLSKLLRPGGGISLRTDAPAYASQMLEVCDATPGLINLSGRGAFARLPLNSFPTPYESKFRKEGREIFYLEYERASTGEEARR